MTPQRFMNELADKMSFWREGGLGGLPQWQGRAHAHTGIHPIYIHRLVRGAAENVRLLTKGGGVEKKFA